jgi:hypothetical protein
VEPDAQISSLIFHTPQRDPGHPAFPLDAQFGPSVNLCRLRHKRFTGRAKRTLERSVREAVALRSRNLGPEHLLLGLTTVDDGRAAAVLRRCGAGPDALRAATLSALRDAA